MAINPSPAYEAANELAYKTPMYTVSFQTIAGTEEYTVTDLNISFPLWIKRAISVDQPAWTVDELAGYTCVITTRRGEQVTREVDGNTADTVTFIQSLPMDTVDIDDTFVLDFYEDFCTYQPADSVFTNRTYKPYVSYISGGGYSITPDEGNTSSATLSIDMVDTDDEITQMIHNATGRLQKKTCIVNAGYVGMDIHDMITVFTGEVTDYKYTKKGIWTIKVSDAIRDLNKNIFRDASDDNVNVITGNPINLILSLLISNTGDGTKGVYDIFPLGYGLNMPISKIDIEAFEEIRDTYYPGTSVTFWFEMTSRESANDFFKAQFYQPLNMYPVVTGDGKYSAKIYRQPLPPYVPYSINENDMLEVPNYDGNLSDLINEVQFSYNYNDDDGKYEDITVFADAESINARGVGDRTLEIECLGVRDTNPDTGGILMDTQGFIEKSAKRIFSRYAEPPVKLSVDLMYRYLLIETGDIILVSNKFLPNLRTGNFDLENIPMEVIKRTVDWKRGKVKLELLQTGYADLKYAGISPILEVDTPVNNEAFTVADVGNYREGYRVTHWRPVFEFERTDDPSTLKGNEETRPYYHMKKLEDNLTITTINGLLITISGLSNPPLEGDVFTFNDTGTLTVDQEFWGRIGAGYLIAP